MKFRDGISIIVTVYNKEQFISKTLETISKQMSGNSQLIIINDGSTDKSELVIKKFIKSQNKDIKYIKQIIKFIKEKIFKKKINSKSD